MQIVNRRVTGFGGGGASAPRSDVGVNKFTKIPPN